MISYLKGILADVQKPGSHKIIVTLEVNHIGYELQVAARQLSALPPLGKPCSSIAICKYATISGCCLALASEKNGTCF